MKNEKLVTTILAALVALMLVLILIQNTIGFGGKKQNVQGRTQTQANAANVEILVAHPSTFIKTISINGELQKKDDARQILADTTGKVTEILVKRGDVVEVGDVVAKADPSTPGSNYKIKEIKATVAGTVISVDSYVGQNLNANTTVVTVGKPEDLILKLNVPEKYLSSFGIGSDAWFTTAAWPEEKYSAVVDFIDSSVKTSTRTVAVELKISNPTNHLMEGMFVRSRLIVEKKDNVFIVPTDVISTYLSDETLYVVNEQNIAVRKTVTTGSYNDTDTIITGGLSEGDRVVVLGSVTDGTPVNIIN